MLDSEDEDNMIPLNIMSHLPSDTASHLRRLDNSLYLSTTWQAIV
jgi:hypothetical protein